jgi:hypothetical protein
MPRTTTAGATPAPSLIRWGAVIAGVILGMSLLLLLAALWVAIGFGTGAEAVAENLEWFMAGSAIVAMLAGGYLAGWLSGVPGTAPGFFNGLTVWGAILIGSIAVGAPGVLGTVNIDPATLTGQEVGMQGEALWAPFVALLIGALAAGLGGVLGGATTRPASAYTGVVDTARGDRYAVREEEHVRTGDRTAEEADRTGDGVVRERREHVGNDREETRVTGDARDERTIQLRDDEVHRSDGRR